jgi:hypothetical protein
MMRNVMYGKSNDLTKYCEYAKCQKQIIYEKVKTSTNDPSVTKRVQYAQYTRNFKGCNRTVDAAGNIIG